MAYLHINNLYKDKKILEFKHCYATEKVHGTSAHIKYKEGNISYFSGGVDKLEFIKLFDKEFIKSKFIEVGRADITIYGEAYGGKCQGMSHTYGKNLKFIVFEVKIAHKWLAVPQAEQIAKTFGLDFVPYKYIETSVDAINQEMEADSIVAINNGVGEGKKREGVVLRPPFEVTLNNGERVIAKHKREDFQETKTPRTLDEDRLRLLTEANEIAEEWVTEMRLTHVMDKLPKPYSPNVIPDLIKAMLEDIEREGMGEYKNSKAARREIGKRTVTLFKDRLKTQLEGE